MRPVATLLILSFIVAPPTRAAAQPAPATQPTTAPVSAPAPRAETAIELALLHLERRQHGDGHFGADPKLALTGLALTAYLACGHAPDLGRHGGTVRRAIDYLVRSAPQDGYFGKVDGGRMYGQAIVVIALCQAYGLDEEPVRRATLRAVLVRAVKVIVDAQYVKKEPIHAGGWRYEPASADSDLSVTAWNAAALRAARDVGLHVPDAALNSAAAYGKRCVHAPSGGFAYVPAGAPGIATTAAGALTLSLLGGVDEATEISAGAAYLHAHPLTDATRFPYYAMYHASQAAHRAGGEAWVVVFRGCQERLLRTQLPSGAWPQSASPEEPGEVYATAMAALALAAPQRVLPLFHR